LGWARSLLAHRVGFDPGGGDQMPVPSVVIEEHTLAQEALAGVAGSIGAS
jgi:hypothetical protein